jgi:hypothetical protein
MREAQESFGLSPSDSYTFHFVVTDDDGGSYIVPELAWAGVSEIANGRIKLVVRMKEDREGAGAAEKGVAVVQVQERRGGIEKVHPQGPPPPLHQNVHLDSPPPEQPPFSSQPRASQQQSSQRSEMVVPATPEPTDEEVEDSDAEGDSVSRRKLDIETGDDQVRSYFCQLTNARVLTHDVL